MQGWNNALKDLGSDIEKFLDSSREKQQRVIERLEARTSKMRQSRKKHHLVCLAGVLKALGHKPLTRQEQHGKV